MIKVKTTSPDGVLGDENHGNGAYGKLHAIIKDNAIAGCDIISVSYSITYKATDDDGHNEPPRDGYKHAFCVCYRG